MPVISSPLSSRPSSAQTSRPGSAASSVAAASPSDRASARDVLASPRRESQSPVMPSLASPRPRPVRRNLGPVFDGLRLEIPENLALSDAASSAPGSDRSDISVRSGVWQAVANQHDEELIYVQQHLGRVVQAMRDVIVSIYAIEDRPAPPRGDGASTPLWREKVELSDPNFIERLLPLAVMRALVAREPTQEGAMQIFEAFADHPEQLLLGLKAVHLYTDLEKLSEQHGQATTQQTLTRGLESRVWESAGPEDASFTEGCRKAAHTLLEIVAEVPEITRNALVRAAVKAFYSEATP